MLLIVGSGWGGGYSLGCVLPPSICLPAQLQNVKFFTQKKTQTWAFSKNLLPTSKMPPFIHFCHLAFFGTDISVRSVTFRNYVPLSIHMSSCTICPLFPIGNIDSGDPVLLPLATMGLCNMVYLDIFDLMEMLQIFFVWLGIRESFNALRGFLSKFTVDWSPSSGVHSGREVDILSGRDKKRDD